MYTVSRRHPFYATIVKLISRCPTECRLSQSESPWRCTVSLRRTTDGQVSDVPFGKPILESAKSDVEDRIRRAQLAILNPSKPAEEFLAANDVYEFGDPELTFSKDCVSLDIRGPGVADLSFCDLPGRKSTEQHRPVHLSDLSLHS